ncbi:MAG: translation initiation factor IF-2 [bacterium]
MTEKKTEKKTKKKAEKKLEKKIEKKAVKKLEHKKEVKKPKKTGVQKTKAVVTAEEEIPKEKKKKVIIVKSKQRKESAPIKEKAHKPVNAVHKIHEEPVIPAPLPVPEVKSIPEPVEEEKPRITIQINEMVTVKTLSEKLQIKVTDLIKKMLSMGTLVTINQRLDKDTCILISNEYNANVEWIPLYGDTDKQIEEIDDPATLVQRPPIVTIMGHVDHGKTSLLDAIRSTNVVSKEAGGITQHIGAYRVKSKHGEIVFLDTPGHEAFTAMRARGTQTTDIVVLVVAANDGVMPQTVEAIDHARAANVPIMVAINKIDLPDINLQKVKQQLSQYNLVPEDWGGKTITVEVSAANGTNIDKLLEMILLQTEMMELKANPNRSAVGVVVEARMDPKRGSIATVLVQKGTVRNGDTFVAGLCNGRIRALIDDRGKHVREAGPSIPVEIMGLTGTPQAGDRFVVVPSEKEARIIAARRQLISREENLLKRRHLSLEDINQQIVEGKIQELKIIIKADVQGSVEALRDSLEKLSVSKISIIILHYGVGGINESNVILAAASDAIIIGFNVRPELQAEKLAEREGVDIRTYRVIYEVVADIRAAMEGLLEPETKEVAIGRAEIRELFKVPKIGTIAGSMVIDGYIERHGFIRLLRNNVIVFEGKISSLKRFKDDVKRVEKGFECGIGIENYQDIKTSDIFEVFIKEKVKRKLES